MTTFIRFMNNFWWRCAVLPPAGSVSWWIYRWTKKLNVPWYLLRYPEECRQRSDMAGWRKAPRIILSLILMPVGFGIWLYGGRRWPLVERRSADGGVLGPVVTWGSR